MYLDLESSPPNHAKYFLKRLPITTYNSKDLLKNIFYPVQYNTHNKIKISRTGHDFSIKQKFFYTVYQRQVFQHLTIFNSENLSLFKRHKKLVNCLSVFHNFV